MKFQRAIKNSALVGSLLLITNCGDSSTGENGNTQGDEYVPGRVPSIQGKFTIDSLSNTLDYTVLTYNGFSGTVSQYNALDAALASKSIIRDLSVTYPGNLYLLYVYQDSVGAVGKKPTAIPMPYNITLPSGISISTGPTLLSPTLAMSNSGAVPSIDDTIIPSEANAVILTIPAGLKDAPETPFFPKGTRYTAVLAETKTDVSDKHSAVFSIESSKDNPVIFGALAHNVGSPFSLRFYDDSSTIDSSLGDSIPLLTKTAAPGIIKARFLSLVADDLPVMSLQSMNSAELKGLGTTAPTLLSLLNEFFPTLVETKKQGTETVAEVKFNPEHGIFCLGGNNKFHTVDLDHQTFVYPMSGSAQNTTIEIVNVSNDSGFIAETGKHIKVTNLNGNGTLRLITVMKDAPASGAPAIIEVDTLNGINKVNVVVGNVSDAFNLSSFPAEGIVLLSYANNKTMPVTAATEDANIRGSLYDGETKVEDGKVILTQLVKKSSSLGAGAIHRVLSMHSETQGVSGKRLRQLAIALDPIRHVSYSSGGLSIAHMNHLSNLHLNRSSSTHFATPLSKHLSISASHMSGHRVISNNFNYATTNLGLNASIYGVVNDKQETSIGAALIGFKHIPINQTTIIPSVAVGYDSNKFNDVNLSAEKIRIGLKDISLNSIFARLMTTFKYTENNLTTSLTAGLEARRSAFSEGNVISDHMEASVKGESLSRVNSFIEATFTAETIEMKAALWNFNQVEVNFGISR